MSDAPSIRALLDAATERLGDHAEARRIVEDVTGWAGAELVLHFDDASTALIRARWSQLVDRRAAGEPLQYVLGGWGFRTLDLLVDRRVLIPRPETERVVDVALEALDSMGAGEHTVVDLGTGSGAIALSIAVERPSVHVWATDRSPDALAVARANLAGIGRAATRVMLAEGDWFEALPATLAGNVDLVVANPPYVATGDELPVEIEEWEPVEALIAGPTGLEAVARIVDDAPAWLRPSGAVVMEIGETQASAAVELARDAGFTAVDVQNDLTQRPRVLVAHHGMLSDHTP